MPVCGCVSTASAVLFSFQVTSSSFEPIQENTVTSSNSDANNRTATNNSNVEANYTNKSCSFFSYLSKTTKVSLSLQSFSN